MDHKTLPRDVFIYLLSIITLTACAIAFGTLVFQYINLKLPDSVDYYCASCLQSTIRYAMATLIIVFPVFIWISSFTRKDITQNPEKRDLKIRRWLLYLTLFAAALVIIGDLVTLLYSFLNGELTNRFVLKVLTILFIAGSIFVHYFSELKDKKDEFKWIGWFDKAVIVVVIVSIVSGFWIAGSPKQQRLVRLDETRVNDLSYIQSEVVNYWQRKQILPASLSDLQNDISGFSVPRDPDSGVNYEYWALGSNRFELCANFSTSNLDQPRNELSVARPYYGMPANWSHGEGRVCFEREIDPQLYPPVGKPVVQ